MSVDVAALLTPPSPVAARALDVVRAWSSPALVNHCRRSWAWAVLLAPTVDLEPDPELLFVATMLHDLGVTPSFDAHRVPFEDAGGAVGSVFALGAGWDAVRARRVGEIIERHMWRSVDPEARRRGAPARGRDLARRLRSGLRQVVGGRPAGRHGRAAPPELLGDVRRADPRAG
ncbi:HD domain-containing protein [Curtobacterium flaccumfaciens]